MKGLRRTVNDYLELRRSLGFKLEKEGRLLPDFADYIASHGGSFITTKLALDWVSLPGDVSANWLARRLSVVRGFAKYVCALEPRTEIPASGLIPYRKTRLTPYIYSDKDIQGLMKAARQLRNPLRAFTYSILIGLLVATGMRVGEAIGLDCQDIDWQQGLLVIKSTKFRKSRLVPLHQTTVEALQSYTRMRDRVFPRPRNPSFLVSQVGTRLRYNCVLATFVYLLHEAGIADRHPRRPRLHDMRHSFCVKTILGWYRSGLDVEPLLPVLSTYLGHVDPSNTYWYLTATPELLALAAERLEGASGESL